MIINILTKNQVKKLIQEETKAEFKKINSYLDKFNERLMRLEDEFKVRRAYKK